MRGQIKAGKIGDSGKPMLARLLEFGYGAEGPMPDLDIISETMGHMFVLRLNILTQRLINYLHTGLPGQILRLFHLPISSGN